MLLKDDLKRIRSLRDPSKKMSKSDPDPLSRIQLTDPAEVITKKIRKSVTDSTSLVSYDPIKRPGVSTLLELEAACTDRDPDEIAEQCLLKGLDTGEYKKQVSAVLSNYLQPIQTEYVRLMSDRVYLRKCLDEGASKANSIASVNFKQIRSIVGMD